MIVGVLVGMITGCLMRGGNILVDILLGIVCAVATTLIFHYFTPEFFSMDSGARLWWPSSAPPPGDGGAPAHHLMPLQHDTDHGVPVA